MKKSNFPNHLGENGTAQIVPFFFFLVCFFSSFSGAQANSSPNCYSLRLSPAPSKARTLIPPQPPAFRGYYKEAGRTCRRIRDAPFVLVFVHEAVAAIGLRALLSDHPHCD